MSVVLRGYQQNGVTAIRAAFRAGRKAVAYIAPTGAGKTVVLAYIAAGTTGKNNRLLVLVHRQELIRQSAKALENAGVTFGIIAAGHVPHYDRPIQLAMIQTLVGRPDIGAAPNLIICDEFHHAVSESYLAIIARYPAAKLLGLTATPQRLDGKGLASICEELILGPTVQELIDLGFLCRPTYYAPPTELDLSNVKVTAGDFNKKQLTEAMDRPKITGSAVEHYAKLCPGLPAVVFCASISHALHVRDQFSAAGFPAAAIDGTLGDDERIDRVDALATGRIKVLTSVDVISEGFDLPAASVAILLRPTESLALFLQQVGRILRPGAGKRAYVLDHVGNCLRHGLAEQPRDWSLAGRPRKKNGPAQFRAPLTTCPDCHAVHKSAPKCPICSHVYPPQTRKIAEVDGTLAQLTAAAILAEQTRVQARQAVGQAKDRASLEAIAKARGYSPKWVNVMLWQRQKKVLAKKLAEAPPTLAL